MNCSRCNARVGQYVSGTLTVSAYKTDPLVFDTVLCMECVHDLRDWLAQKPRRLPGRARIKIDGGFEIIE